MSIYNYRSGTSGIFAYKHGQTRLNLSEDSDTNDSFYITFVDIINGTVRTVHTDSALSYNPALELLTVVNLALGGGLTVSNGNDCSIVCTSTAYPAYNLCLGGWDGAPLSTHARIQTSVNLHIDCSSDGRLYLNYYSNKDILTGTGAIVCAAIDSSSTGNFAGLLHAESTFQVDGISTLNAALTVNNQATFNNGDVAGCVFTSTTYSGTTLQVGGYLTQTATNAAIFCTINLHIESPTDNDMYLNWYNARSIHIGLGSLVSNGAATFAGLITANGDVRSDVVSDIANVNSINFSAGTFGGTWTWPGGNWNGALTIPSGDFTLTAGDMIISAGKLIASDGDNVSICATSTTFAGNDVTVGGYFAGTYANDSKIQSTNTHFYMDAKTGGTLSLNHWCTAGLTAIQDNGGNINIGKDVSSILTVNATSTFNHDMTLSSGSFTCTNGSVFVDNGDVVLLDGDVTVTVGNVVLSDGYVEVDDGDLAAIRTTNASYPTRAVTIGGWFAAGGTTDHRITGNVGGFYIDAQVASHLYLNYYNNTRDTVIQGSGGNVGATTYIGTEYRTEIYTGYTTPVYTTGSTDRYFSLYLGNENDSWNSQGIRIATQPNEATLADSTSTSYENEQLTFCYTSSNDGNIMNLASVGADYTTWVNQGRLVFKTAGVNNGSGNSGRLMEQASIDHNGVYSGSKIELDNGNTEAILLTNTTYSADPIALGGWFGGASAADHRIAASNVGFHIDGNTSSSLYFNYYNSSKNTHIQAQGGSVSIGSTSVQNRLTIEGGDASVDYEYYRWFRTHYTADTNGQVGLRQTAKSLHSYWRNTSTNNSEYHYVDNGTTTYAAVSDGRLKFNQQDLGCGKCLKDLMRLKPKSYNKAKYLITNTDGVVDEKGRVVDLDKDEDDEDRLHQTRRECGFIAQDLMEDPDFAEYVRKGDGTTPYGLDYCNLLAVAVGAIQELTMTVRRLRDRVEVLEQA